MGLESASYVNDLNTANPTATDLRAQGDDHLRLLKSVLKTTFPNSSRAFRFTTTGAAVAANVSVTAPDDENKLFVVNATAAARTVAVPTSGLFDGFSFAATKSDSTANTVTVTAAALVNGASTLVLRKQYDLAILTYSSNNSTWTATVFALPYLTITAATAGNYTVAPVDQLATIRIDATAANRTVTLPNTLAAGFICWVRKTDLTANTVTLDATSGGQINGANTLTLRYQHEELRLIWDGTTWSAPVYDGEEPGSAKLWFTDTAPTGWSMLEGQAISRTGNPRLFALFGTTYGIGNGTTTFNLPDIRGRFLRVWDHAKGNDPDAASRTAPSGSTITAGDHVGTEQADTNKAHQHFLLGASTGNTPLTTANYVANQTNFGAGNDANYALYSHTSAAATLGLSSSEGGNEARGKNVAIAVVMKLG